MTIKLVAYGIAKDILGKHQMEIQLEAVNNLGDLKEWLCQQYPDFQKLRSLSLAVNEAYQDDDFALNTEDEVVIIPPVSGG